MDFKSFMIQEVNGEFNFPPEGGLDDNQGSLSAKYVNNETPIINTEPIFVVLPSNVADNIIDSSNTSSGDELPPVHPSTSFFPDVGEKSKAAGKRKLAADALREGSHHRAQKALVQASKVAGDASTPFDVDSDPDIHEFPSARELKDATDCHWVVAYVTPPSWKQHLRDISIEQLCDIHDRAYMQREIKRDTAYAELEKKYNESLQDLDKNPLVFDMRSEIETLQVEGFKSKRERLKASEIQVLQEIDSLRQDRAAIVLNVIPDATMKLVHSDEMGVLVSRLVRAAIIHDEYDQAREDMANASYPFLSEFTSNPYASVEQLLSMKPRSLRSSKAPLNLPV
ncbi:hypothetical protein Tco_1395987, partial [Tanacetum coccineum]